MATNKSITVHFQVQGEEAWCPTHITLDLQEFINAKSPDKFIKNLVELGNMGSPVISISYNFTKEMAQALLGSK